MTAPSFARPTLLALLALVALAAACIPIFDHPLTPEAESTLDESLLGTWTWMEQDGPGYMHLGAEHGRIQMVIVEQDDDGSQDVSVLSGHTSQLGAHRYLNLRFVYREGQRDVQEYKDTWMFLLYRTDAGALTIESMRNDEVKDAIEAGTLDGEAVEDSGWLPMMHVTSDAESVRAFVRAGGSALFANVSTMTRLEPATEAAGR